MKSLLFIPLLVIIVNSGITQSDFGINAGLNYHFLNIRFPPKVDELAEFDGFKSPVSFFVGLTSNGYVSEKLDFGFELNYIHLRGGYNRLDPNVFSWSRTIIVPPLNRIKLKSLRISEYDISYSFLTLQMVPRIKLFPSLGLSFEISPLINFLIYDRSRRTTSTESIVTSTNQVIVSEPVEENIEFVDQKIATGFILGGRWEIELSNDQKISLLIRWMRDWNEYYDSVSGGSGITEQSLLLIGANYTL